MSAPDFVAEMRRDQARKELRVRVFLAALTGSARTVGDSRGVWAQDPDDVVARARAIADEAVKAVSDDA